MASPEGRAPFALRVNQLDAARLDSEISTLLRQQLAEVSPWGSGIPERFQPEVDALLRAVLWRFTIWIDEPTPGGRLQNLRYAQAGGDAGKVEPLRRWQKLALLFLNALLPWLSLRLRAVAHAADELPAEGEAHVGREALWRGEVLRRFARWYLQRAVPCTTTVYSVCVAVNFLVFLRRGVFAAFSDRAVGVRLLHIDPSAHRQTAFEYMNRVMIWNGFSEFLMTVVPLLNLARLRQLVARRVFPASMQQDMEVDARRTCGFCGASPVTVPMRAGCGHLFCYFCVASEQLERRGEATCPRCSSRVQALQHAS